MQERNMARPEITGRRFLKSDLSTWPVELLRIVGVNEVEQLTTLSWDTIKRKHADKIVHLSERRRGMRVGHALMISED
jgi:hypothetical protein